MKEDFVSLFDDKKDAVRFRAAAGYVRLVLVEKPYLVLAQGKRGIAAGEAEIDKCMTQPVKVKRMKCGTLSRKKHPPAPNPMKQVLCVR